ncbi:NADPH-dependent F420 reductase [Elizabethkingia meningoseptica]
MSNTKKVAIIGLGNIGKTIAENLVKGNREVIVASKKLKDAQSLAQQLGGLATAAETADAINQADLIILSVWFSVEQELLSQYNSALQGKIIIDPSNPIAPDEKGGFKKIIGEKESAGEIIASKIPHGATLVKAFGTLGAGSLKKAAFQTPEKAALFYAADDNGVDGDIVKLIEDSGYNAVKVGGLNQSIRIEVFGDLHEFGALGKTVTASEAKNKVSNI